MCPTLKCPWPLAGALWVQEQEGLEARWLGPDSNSEKDFFTLRSDIMGPEQFQPAP